MSEEGTINGLGGSLALPGLDSVLFPEWHPCLHSPSEIEVEGMIRDLGYEGYAEWLGQRTRAIRMAELGYKGADGKEGEPYSYGFELPHWARADQLLRETDLGVYMAGGKRASKSEWAAKRFVQAAMAFPRAVLWAFQSSGKTSIGTQQKLVWKYLPNEVKKLHGKTRHGLAKVNYSIDGGFTEGVLVLPNGTEIHFLTVKSDPHDYQGWEIGAYMDRERLAMLEARPELHNIGGWIDEDCPMTWLKTVEMRCSSRKAKVIWTFSTLNGITTAVKEVLGEPKTLESLPAELLSPAVRHVADCPPGHMPFVQECTRTGWKAIYFHTKLNLFGDNYSEVKKRCVGKSFPVIAEDAYGWSEDARSKAWPMFGSWNIVRPEDVPAEGTNYFYTDPAGARNWASMWVRVCPGNPAEFYIYRDWPPEQVYGPWAEPDENLDGNPDGVPGRGQRSLGLGYAELKEAWAGCERIRVPEEAISMAATLGDGEGKGAMSGLGGSLALPEMLERLVKDAHHRMRIVEAIRDGEDLDSLQEEVFRNYIDPRAGRNAAIAENGGTCAIDELRKEHRNCRGELVPPRRFMPAPGLHIEDGIQAVTDLLSWDKSQPLTRLLNAPQLYVSSECRQVIWCMGNYTKRGGENGGCKDFADLLRYFATSKPRYLAPGLLEVSGGGSY